MVLLYMIIGIAVHASTKKSSKTLGKIEKIAKKREERRALLQQEVMLTFTIEI